MIFREKGTCDGCQKKIEIYDMQMNVGPNKGEWIEWKKGCICDDIRLAKEAMSNKKQQEFKRAKRFFDEHSLINNALRQANFANFEPKNESQDYAKRASQRFVEIFDLDNPKNISFHGTFGIGKSHLAKSIADGIMGMKYQDQYDVERRHTSIFISVPKLLRKIKSTYDRNSEVNEDDIIKVLENVNLLVLDDIGAESSTDWVKETLFDVIDSRQGKHTIYTTNYSPKDLIEKLGERNFSRVINQDTTVIELDGKNHRLSNFKTQGDKTNE